MTSSRRARRSTVSSPKASESRRAPFTMLRFTPLAVGYVRERELQPAVNDNSQCRLRGAPLPARSTVSPRHHDANEDTESNHAYDVQVRDVQVRHAAQPPTKGWNSDQGLAGSPARERFAKRWIFSHKFPTTALLGLKNFIQQANLLFLADRICTFL